MKVALVYDRVNKWGGAERVLIALHELFPKAPLFTSVRSVAADWAEIFPSVKTSHLQKLNFSRNNHEYFALFMPLIFESFDFCEFDLVVSVTSESAKGIITSPHTKHVCYLLTPTRYLWSGYGNYFTNNIFRNASIPAVKYLRKWDVLAAQRPDTIVAISREVQNRIKNYYNRNAEVVSPPVANNFFNQRIEPKKEQFYLLVSRLVGYKNVEVAIKAFNKLGCKLVIIGEGRQEKKLKNMANSNIKFINRLTDEELATYYSKAKALVFPQIEDFGLVAAEAQALGTPVIAFRKGGIQDIVEDGKTGIFFDKQDEDSLINAIDRFDGIFFDPIYIKQNARRFSKENFKKNFTKLINK